jgi:hypothetical protein
MNQIKTNQKIFVEETQEFKKRRSNLIWWLIPISALGFYFFIRNKKKQHKI